MTAAPKIPANLTELKALRKEEIATLLADPAGRREIDRLLRGRPPIDKTKLGDSKVLNSLSVEDWADLWPEIMAATGGKLQTGGSK